MAQQPDIAAIIAALGTNNSNGTPTPANQPTSRSPLPPGNPGATSATTPSNPVAGLPLPQPTNTGNVDLSSVKPVSSGSVSLTDAIAKAKGIFDQKSSQRDEARARNPTYRRSRSRSRSPPRRDTYRENYNPYRDERRDEPRRTPNGRDRSVSPPRHAPAYSPTRAVNQGRDRSTPPKPDENSEVISIESSSVGLVIGRNGENLRRVEQETGARVQFMPDLGSPFRQCKISGTPRQRADAKRDILRVAADNPRSQPTSAPTYDGTGLRVTGTASQPPGRDGDFNLQIMVPDKTVGLIIGRGGETIRDLQERSGCHVNIVSENKSVGGFRPVNLIGSREATMKAKQLILEVVDSDTRSAPPAQAAQLPPMPATSHHPQAVYEPYQQFDPASPPGTTDSITVPSEAVGMIIGKGGETIREMQNSTGCKINVSPPEGADINRSIGLIGSRSAMESAKHAIYEKVSAVREKQGGHFTRGGDMPPPQYDPYSHPAAPYGQQLPPSQPGPSQMPEQPDPYAHFGGYNNYVAWWYSTYANHAQGGHQPPGH